jgi:hypothetical protein
VSEKNEGRPIPREFHSEYEERPFRTCSRCGEALEGFDCYQINKSWRNGECVFEFVFCEVCRDRMIDEFSEESKKRLMKHEQDHLKHTGGTGSCGFCGKTREDAPMRDYVLTAVCRGERMLDSLMICEACHLKAHELLSSKTRDVRRRFIEDLPGVPPDWEGLPVEEEVLQFANAKGGGKLTRPMSKLHGSAGAVVQGRNASDVMLLPMTELVWHGSRGDALKK